MTLLKKSRLGMIALVGGLLLIILFLASFQTLVQRHEEEALQGYLEEIRDSASYMLRAEIERFSSLIANEARTIGLLGELTDMQILEELHAFPRENFMLRLHILTTEGRFYSSLDYDMRQYEPELYDAVFSSEGICISAPRYSTTFQRKVVEISAPLHINGKASGVLVGCYDLNFFETLLQTNFLEGDCSISLATRDGTLISHSTSGTVPTGFEDNIFDFYHLPDVHFEQSSADELHASIQEDKEGYAVYETEGVLRFLSYAPVGVDDWYLAAIATDRTLDEQAAAINGYAMILVTGVSMTVLLICAVILMIRAREHTVVEKLLQRSASTDPLTHLYNRTALEERSNRFLKLDGSGGLHALLMFDIDGFKLVNDRFGHLQGDALLFVFAELMRETFPERAILGRIGGDEFIALLPNCESVHEVEQLAAAFCENFRNAQHRLEPKQDLGQTSTSIGIAFYAEHAVTFHKLYHCADLALYRSKNAGRDRYTLYTEEASCALSDNQEPPAPSA